MSIANRHLGLKLIALTLVVTIFAMLLPSRMVFWAEDGQAPQFANPEYDTGSMPDTFTEEPSPDNTIDALFEDTDLRTSNSKTLRLNDGTYTLGSYGFNIHFQTADGFVEYDNTLALKDNCFQPSVSDIDLSFAIDRPAYTIGFNGIDVSFELINDSLQVTEAQISELPKQEYSTRSAELFAVPNAKSQLTYSNILDGVSVSYLLYGRNIKESIVLETLPENTVFRFAVTTDAELFIDDEGCIHIGEAIIPHAYMYDALGNISDCVTYTLEQTENGHILTITPERGWLEDDSRIFPVVIDPTIITDSPTHGDVSDAYIREALPNFNSNYYYLMHVGNATNDNQLHKLRSFFKINNLPEIPKASRILSAIVSLQQAGSGNWYSFNSTYSNYLTVVAKEVTSAWSEETVTWNNQPLFSDKVIDYVVSAAASAECYLNFDITSCMQKWYEDSSTNYGIVLQSATEQYDGFTTFITTDDIVYSTTHPSFYITYYDTKGLESRWAYALEDVGTAGTVYVNLYNGKHVLTSPGLSTQDEILPLSVYPIYNGYLSGLQFTPNASNKNAPITANFNATAGFGFKLSCWESLTFKTISGVNYYCYNDADGTELYFREYPGLGYLSEDGYDLSLSINSNSTSSRFVISDSSGNEKHFNSAGRIKYIKDEYGNQKSFNYDSNNRLTSISFKSQSMASFDPQLTFSYNTGNALQRITNAKDTSVYLDFYYSTTRSGPVSTDYTGYLRKVQYSNGDFAEYQYDSNDNLYRIRQGNGSTYGVYAMLFFGTDGRVSELHQYSSDGYLGNKFTFEYDHKKTVIRTAGKNDIHGDTDDLLSVYLFDNYGNTVCSYLTDFTGETVYGASSAEYTELNVSTNPKANNSVSKTGSKGQYNKNLISNGNLEYTSGWTQSLSYVSCSVSSTEYMFGTKSIYLSGSSSICSGTLSQNVNITEPGTYTLSAYVKSNMSMGFTTTINGAYISIDGEKSDIISGPTNADVQNGWRKLSVTKTFTTAGTYTVELGLRNMYGPIYFDGVSLIKSDSPATEFNYLSNSWISLGTLETQTDGSVKLSCSPGGSSIGYSIVSLNKPASCAAYILAGWSMGYSVPEEDTSDYPATMTNTHKDRFWGMTAVIYYSDGTSETQKVHFNPAVSGQWQYTSGVIMPSENNLTKTVTSIWINLRYDNNANYAFFKDVCLIETDAASYEYDSNGNVTKARNTKSSSQLIYSGTDLTGVTDSNGNGISYTYVSNKHKVLTATDDHGVTATYGYDTNGLANSVIVTPSAGSEQMISSVTYNDYGNLISGTDAFDHTTSYGYNTGRGLLNYLDNANNKRTQYLYDLGGKLTEVFSDNDKDGIHDSGEAGVQYTYNAKNYMTEICNGLTTYHFAYDNYGNITSVTIGDNTSPLVSYSYASRNGKLQSTTYANGTIISNTYDEIDRIKAVYYNGTIAYTITYDGEGNVASYTDCSTGRIYRYEYDALGREIRFFVTLNGTELYAAEKIYDAKGNVAGYSYNITGVNFRTSTNTFDQHNNLTQSTTAGGDVISYTYDGFGRVVSKTTGNFKEFYEYKTSGNNTSTLLSKITYKYNNTTYKTVLYTYDAVGNVLTEDDGTTYRQYTYDSLNQLASDLYYNKSTFIGKCKYYSNNINGNVSYIEFDYNNGNYSTSGGSSQGYGNNTDWKELMTSYGGTPITYDANGNPLSYYNGQSYTFTWQKGRQLASTTTNNSQISYSYDVTGKRISKNIDGTVHDYTYDGSLLLCDKWGNKYVEYFYDAEGNPYALNYYNGSSSTKYFFARNVAGDILELRTTGGTLVARYIYDTWGKLLSIKDSSGNEITSSTNIAILNVLRYRGYFYDTETKLYYLESRYYDPQTQRFLNSDRIEVLGVGGDILSYNSFAYCENNPVNRADHDGNFWHILAGAVFGAIGGAISSIVSQVTSGQEINWKAVGISAASGAISGAITAACPCMGPVAAGVVQGTLSAATYAVTEKVAYGRDPSLGETLKVGLISGVTAGVTQYVGQELGLIQCFISGTIVASKDGPKKIEDIQVGDLVWATDPKTGETELKEVKQLFRNETDEWIHIKVNDEEIVCTPNHPFWVPVKGWIKACHLRAGDRLQLLNGEYVVVEQVQHELLEQPETTYNFEVECLHTYFVGEGGVLVHNKCTSRAAMREAKRSVNVPMSQKPDSVSFVKMTGSDGRTVFAKLEVYGDKFIRNDLGGHLFKDGSTMSRHYNAGIVKIVDGVQDFISNGQHFFY